MRFNPSVEDTHIRGKYFDQPMFGPACDPADCIGLQDGRYWEFEDCIIDVSNCAPESIDEAIGVTWGSSAEFRNCVIRGAGKLVLCGSGDKHMAEAERGKTVKFEHCLLEDFGRRGPEVQAGMSVVLHKCLIRDWGIPAKFDTRSFAAWAHHGGSITAHQCIFTQTNPWHGLRQYLCDVGNHLGQALKYNWLSVLDYRNLLPGTRKALYASHGGRATSVLCHARGLYVADYSSRNSMPREEAEALYLELLDMRDALYTKISRG